MARNAVELEIPSDIEKNDVSRILEWAGKQFDDKAGFASSFSPEDVVIIDMLSKLNSPVKIFTLDTCRLHDETYRVMEDIRQKYQINIEVYFPDGNRIEKLERENGFYSFYQSLEARKECCNIRKVEPLNRALSKLHAWITGLRREQSLTRQALQKVEIDYGHNEIIKINPLLDWSEKQVWDYIQEHNVPYNKLFDKGFTSIGCAPCTRAIKRTEDIRAGRWWWEDPHHKECGLHIKIGRLED